MVGRGSPFARNYSIGNTSKTTFPKDFIPEENLGSEVEGLECMYAILF